MDYIDKDYYRNIYKGSPIDSDSELDILITRASRDIDRYTRYVIVQTGFDNLIEFQQDRVKEATAAQVEFLDINGLTASTVDSGAGGSFDIGNYSEGKGAAGGGGQSNRTVTLYANNIYDILSPTGLLYSGVPTISRGGDCCG
ncbi:hypothetical protein [Listeria booriae]|uniref:hypothetical protein n=1 Tax=Listeria booriae TaxID=1552123 RepID=UPI00162A8870|nr:hypothetical protein [Listeria booriae]MBC2392211.1 hypothetical protein [Listeria booriae]